MKKGVLIIAVIVLLPLLFLEVKNIQLQAHNECPISIETFDGGSSPYHPSVIYKSDGFGGYKYWMAETPFPYGKGPYRDRWECPSIHVSRDGYSWDTPKGLRNPIDDLTEEEISDLDFFSDPHLFMKGDTLECWYRFSKCHALPGYPSSSETSLFRKCSVDGVNWSIRDTLMDITRRFGKELGSPSVIFDRNYLMWMVDFSAEDKEKIVFLTSADSKNWTDAVLCKLDGMDCSPWHIDVAHFDGEHWLTVYEKSERITLWKSRDGINFEHKTTLLDNNGLDGSFDELGYYRASLVKVNDYDYRLYYSAKSMKSTHIGVLQGGRPFDMKYKNCRKGKFSTFWDLAGMYYEKVSTRVRLWFQ